MSEQDGIARAAALDEAAAFLVAARHAGRPGKLLPEALRPTDMAEAWALRGRVGARLGVAVGGWKCGLPKEGKINAAPIYAPGITRISPVRMTIEGNEASIEPEIAFVLGRDLPPEGAPYDLEAITAAIASAHLALELIGCRYAEPQTASYPEMFADGLFNQGLFIGPETPFPPPADIALSIEGPDGVVLTRDGRHPDGDPPAPLVWLANLLASRGEGLRAGQAVITGSYAGVLNVPARTKLRIRFGSLGMIEAVFGP